MSEIVIEEQVVVMTPATATLTPVVEQVTLTMDQITGAVNIAQTVIEANLSNPQPLALQVQTSSIIGEVAGGPPGPPGPPGPAGSGTSDWTIQTVTAAGTTVITAGDNKQIEVDCTLGNITIQLPDLTGMLKKDIRIKRLNTGPNVITVLPHSGQTIDGESSWELYDKNECLVLNAQTGFWRIV